MKFLSDPLPPKALEHRDSHRYLLMNRVINFDPAEVYERVGQYLNPYKRLQSGLTMAQMWPGIPGKCSCGCGLDLIGRRTRWGSELCSKFPNEVFNIIYGHVADITRYIQAYWGDVCAKCRESHESIYARTPWERRTEHGWCALYLDHVIPVKHGGGACWLGNYQLLCEACHRVKTNEDFGWKQAKLDMPDQLKLL